MAGHASCPAFAQSNTYLALGFERRDALLGDVAVLCLIRVVQLELLVLLQLDLALVGELVKDAVYVGSLHGLVQVVKHIDSRVRLVLLRCVGTTDGHASKEEQGLHM